MIRGATVFIRERLGRFLAGRLKSPLAPLCERGGKRGRPRAAHALFPLLAFAMAAAGTGSTLTAAAAEPTGGLDQAAALRLSQSVVGRPIGDYTLTDRAGRVISLSQYRGKPLLVSFVYTGCFQVCPTATRFLSEAVKVAQDALRADSFAVVTIGFNLPYDTPQAMRAFARQHGIGAPNWEFLSPDPATLERLTRDFGFTFAPTPKGFDHITQVSIVDQQGRLFRQVYGESFEVPMLVAPLRELLTGAPSASQDLAGLIEKIRLFCTVYDPRSGTYRLNYALFIEILVGASIIGATGYFLVSEWLRSRRARRA